MEDPNPYSAPQSEVRDVEAKICLGGRGERLGAVLIDAFIILTIMLPAMYFGGYFSGIMQGVRPPFATQALWSLMGFAVMIAIQGYPLAQSGQTWGKKLLKLKIVNLDGTQPDFLRLVGLRYAPTQAISLVPFVGSLYGLVDSLFIFREDRRCIHDHIAGTRVVVAD